MRISHRILEAIRRNPKLIAESAKSQGGSNSIARNWQFKLKPYHTADFTIGHVANNFEEYCLNTFSNTKSNLRKISEFYGRYSQYETNYHEKNLVFLEFHKRIHFQIQGDFKLSGEVFRIDRTRDGGYAITLFWNNQESDIWASELRFPVLQKFFADEFGVTTNKVKVGILDFENVLHEYITFDEEAIEDAMNELSDIIEVIGKVVL